MAGEHATRIVVQEGAYTFLSNRLDKLLLEIDARLNCNEVYEDISYDIDDLIEKIEVFSDLARTKKVVERTFTRFTGGNGVEYISSITTIFYNKDTSEDSRVTTTITRNGDDQITSCDNVFSTSESQKL